MAPTHLEQQITTTPLLIMSNSKTNALSMSNRIHNHSISTSSNSSLCVIHIGKDMQPVTVAKISSVNSFPWKSHPVLAASRKHYTPP